MKLREILTFEDAELGEALRPAIDAIDFVHAFPSLPTCPVLRSRKRSEQGSYIFRPRPNIPLRLEISKFAVYPSLTLIHEVGHLLDTLVLNPLRSGFGSEHNLRFQPFLRGIAATETVRHLARLASNKGIRASPAAKRDLRSLLDPPEIWARAYVQWIAGKTSDEMIKVPFAEARESGIIFALRRVRLQWEDDEFADIMPLVDDLLKEVRR